MSLNLWYSFQEGFRGLRRARLASIVTISTISVTLFLLSLFALLTINIQHIIETFKEKMTLEVFIDNSQKMDQIQDLERRLFLIPGVQKAVFISKEEALVKFREEFGNDPISLLGENPLPPSFQIVIKSSYRTPDLIESVVQQLNQMDGVDEVVYHGRFFKAVDRYSRLILIVDICLVVFALASTFILVANTLRLTLQAQSKSIQIMRLIGATKGFIQRPFWIQGIIEGGLGGILAAVVLYIVLKGIQLRFPIVRLYGVLPVVMIPVVLGVLLGFFGSLIGLKRFLKT